MAVNKVEINGVVKLDLTQDTVTKGTLLQGVTAHDAAGNPVEGTMVNNGAIAKTIDGLTQTSVAVPAGYTSGGTVSLTNDIEMALAAI